MYIIVGLGNPGKKYENTKHNVGFITLDFLADKNDIKINKIKHKALVGEGTISGQKVLLVKPQTFMNLSGNSVKEVMDYYKVDIENLIVIYDDVDIPMGRLRVRKKGSAGTHNGMRSIIYDLQEDGFPRVRIGNGGDRKMSLAGYVLGGFGKEEKSTMEDTVKKAAMAIECMIEKGIDIAMGEYNIKPSAEGEAKKDE
ncbi:MAG: aminoacyl-tRNA hydrolase [Clostridia bacterium]|nr:aminoacyl-tRNA hydrolase [Clostridia bacterium]